MRRFSIALDGLAIAVGAPALAVSILALVDRAPTLAWISSVGFSVAVALFAAATPGRGRWWRASALLCVIPAVPMLGLGLALVSFGPSSDSGSWGPVIAGCGLAAFGASFLVLALVALCHSSSAMPSGIALGTATTLGGLIVMVNDERVFLACGVGGLVMQATALQSAAWKLTRVPRPPELAMLALAGEACAAGWIAFFMYSDSKSGYDEDAVTIALVALACALLLSAVIALTRQPLLRMLVRIPAFAAAAAVALLLTFDARFPGSEAMLLLAGASLTYAYVLARPRERRLLPALEVIALPLAALVLFTEVPGFGLALALAGVIVAAEWRRLPRGQAGLPG